mmetsp:Transcript_34621/g.73736  ORF Transcript_34621/g.73736 Transcript_34621/m.73736 type:complete len:355 (-) Transcript_34621:117-1181(-)
MTSTLHHHRQGSEIPSFSLGALQLALLPPRLGLRQVVAPRPPPPPLDLILHVLVELPEGFRRYRVHVHLDLASSVELFPVVLMSLYPGYRVRAEPVLRRILQRPRAIHVDHLEDVTQLHPRQPLQPRREPRPYVEGDDPRGVVSRPAVLPRRGRRRRSLLVGHGGGPPRRGQAAGPGLSPPSRRGRLPAGPAHACAGADDVLAVLVDQFLKPLLEPLAVALSEAVEVAPVGVVRHAVPPHQPYVVRALGRVGVLPLVKLSLDRPEVHQLGDDLGVIVEAESLPVDGLAEGDAVGARHEVAYDLPHLAEGVGELLPRGRLVAVVVERRLRSAHRHGMRCPWAVSRKPKNEWCFLF